MTARKHEVRRKRVTPRERLLYDALMRIRDLPRDDSAAAEAGSMRGIAAGTLIICDVFYKGAILGQPRAKKAMAPQAKRGRAR